MCDWDREHEQGAVRSLLDLTRELGDMLGRCFLYTARTQKEKRTHARC